MEEKDKEKAKAILEQLTKMQDALIAALQGATEEEQKKSSETGLASELAGQIETLVAKTKVEVTPELKPAAKSHVTEVASYITPTATRRASPRSSPSNPYKRSTKTSGPKAFRSTGSTASKRTKPKGTSKSTKSSTGKVTCKLCGYKAKDIGALSRHRAKKHPQASKKSAQRGASTRKDKPKRAVMSGGINVDTYIGNAIKRGQDRRRNK